MEERIIELSVDNRSEVIKLPINPKTCLLYTSISYRDPSASRSATVDFMKNYETSLNHYKKMRLPKDNHAGS